MDHLVLSLLSLLLLVSPVLMAETGRSVNGVHQQVKSHDDPSSSTSSALERTTCSLSPPHHTADHVPEPSVLAEEYPAGPSGDQATAMSTQNHDTILESPSPPAPPPPPPVTNPINGPTGFGTGSSPPVAGATARGVLLNDDEGRRPFRLGEIFLGLAFQAAIGLIQARFNSSPSPSPSSSPSASSSSVPSNMAGVTLIAGFTFTTMGLMLHRLHPDVANRFNSLGIFSSALGFFFMMDMYVPESYGWLVWAAAGVLVLVFVYSLVRESE